MTDTRSQVEVTLSKYAVLLPWILTACLTGIQLCSVSGLLLSAVRDIKDSFAGKCPATCDRILYNKLHCMCQALAYLKFLASLKNTFLQCACMHSAHSTALQGQKNTHIEPATQAWDSRFSHSTAFPSVPGPHTLLCRTQIPAAQTSAPHP